MCSNATGFFKHRIKIAYYIPPITSHIAKRKSIIYVLPPVIKIY